MLLERGLCYSLFQPDPCCGGNAQEIFFEGESEPMRLVSAADRSATNAVLDMCKKQLGLDVNPLTHRIPANSIEKNRPVIVNFVRGLIKKWYNEKHFVALSNVLLQSASSSKTL